MAIGEAKERELRGRVGVNQHTHEGKENFPDPAPQGQTRDLAAQAAGFGNGKTYEQAKKVTHQAAPEIVEAMDSGALALRMKPIMEERAKANSVASGENYGKGSQKSDEPIKPIRTDEAVSELANVSRDTIRKIERIEEVAQPEAAPRNRRNLRLHPSAFEMPKLRSPRRGAFLRLPM